MWLQKVKKGSWLLFSLIALGVILQSCMKKDGEDFYDFYGILSQDVQTIQTYLDANGIDAEVDTTGVFYRIEEVGEGYKTVYNADLEVHIKGSTLDGVEFLDAQASDPLTVVLGEGNSSSRVTTGLLIGLLDRFEGDSVTVYVPSPWGFQDKADATVPANSILVYKLKLMAIKTLEEDYTLIDEYISAKNWTASIEPEYGIRYVVHKPGDQNVKAEYGDDMIVDYQGEFLDGTVFDSSVGKSPLPFNIGSGSLVVGFEAGASQLYEKDSATIFIPSVYGYGKNGRTGIEPNTPLVFGLDVLSVIK